MVITYYFLDSGGWETQLDVKDYQVRVKGIPAKYIE